ncbi:MAG TPA: hypothetical protein VGL61_03330 [Kofleriaceae bacterium]
MWEIAEYAIDRVIADEPDWACFEASHAILPRRVRITIATAASSANSILREAKILESLRHPGVPRVYECGYLDDQLPWVATELVAGPSVDGSLAVRALAELLRDVGAILAFAHARGVIHGDISLDAIVLGETVRLVEWRRARAGTPIEATEDVYALGLAAYAVMPAKPPRRLAALIADMLATDPAARPTASEIAELAARVLEEPADDDVEEIEEIDLSRQPPLWIGTDPGASDSSESRG